ncbi:MAG: 3-keto-disaccharide hydrolase [Thermoguttaceae bacterium]
MIFMKPFQVSCVFAAFLFVSPFLSAQDKKPAEYTSVEQVTKSVDVNRDFQIQGEYVTEVDNRTFGLQVIADGGGKFRFVCYFGGLPGDGWKPNETRIHGNATLEGEDKLRFTLNQLPKDQQEVTKFENSKLPDVQIKPNQLVVNRPGDEPIVFNRVERKSPTLNLAPPEGAVVLFADGKASNLFETARINEEAKTLWSEASTKPFEKKPYKLHVEFLLSYMPEARGQARSNSGVYVDEAYECQVLDSFGLEGENNECGGYYQVSKPLVNMCFPPLQWQTYDIDVMPATFDSDGKKVANAKITTRHNGVIIHENMEPEKETPGRKKETADARGLYLQGHGNNVQYRNIWLKYQ